MIFDRTSKDVAESKRIINEKIKKFIAINDEEFEILKRGTLGIETINRIESKQSELSQLLNSMGYYSAIQNKVDWNDTDIFKDEDLNRIVENNAILRNTFFVYKYTPINAVAKYDYSEFNSLEKILFDLENMTKYVLSHYRECGTFECGE